MHACIRAQTPPIATRGRGWGLGTRLYANAVYGYSEFRVALRNCVCVLRAYTIGVYKFDCACRRATSTKLRTRAQTNTNTTRKTQTQFLNATEIHCIQPYAHALRFKFKSERPFFQVGVLVLWYMVFQVSTVFRRTETSSKMAAENRMKAKLYHPAVATINLEKER